MINAVSTKLLLLLFTLFFFSSLIAVETDLSASAGGGWKSDLDPVISFRSASDIFKRQEQQSGAILNFFASGGLSAKEGAGFFADVSVGTLLSLHSMENSILDSSLEVGYLFSSKKVHLFAINGTFHNYSVNFKNMRSLFVDPSLNFSYLYDGSEIFAFFFRVGATYYIPTTDNAKYLNGLSFFNELGSTFFISELFFLDVFTGVTFTFLKDQEIVYNRYNDVFYGDLDIAGKYYSVYVGVSGNFEIKDFFIPATVKYTFSRSFDKDVHKMIYWDDMEMLPTIVKKTRTDNIAEFSIGAGYRFGDNYSLKATYDFYSDFSNVSGEYGDYADYNRTSHTVTMEFEYVY